LLPMTSRLNIPVTGASSGTSYTTVERLPRDGTSLFGGARRTDHLARLRHNFGAVFMPVHFDVADTQATARVAAEMAVATA
jgi:NADP-dependent 3-hydroxy acid dehydrogenase YdfG